MFHFATPWFLLLLASLPLLAWLRLRARTLAVRHPSLSLFAGLPVGSSRLAEYGGLALRLVGLAALVIALAQPRWPDLRTRLDTEGIAILVVLDTSGSMAERDFLWNGEQVSRLDAVKRVFRLFVEGSRSGERLADGNKARLEGRPGDLIGLVSFATRPEVTCPLTLSHPTLLRLLDAEEPRGVVGESETNISDAVTLGLERLRSAAPRRKIVVLLTDGEHNQDKTRSDYSPRQTAHLAASLGIPLHAIDAGSDVPADDPGAALRTRSVTTLKELAEITGGTYFAAGDSSGLLASIRAIDRMERTKITSYQYRRYHEGYPWFALGAFACFVLAVALERTLWRRLP